MRARAGVCVRVCFETNQMCIDLFLFCFVFFLFNPAPSCGPPTCRMTPIGNTLSGVTGLRSVWWTLAMLSPSLLTPGSRCMHGRSGNPSHGITCIRPSPAPHCSSHLVPIKPAAIHLLHSHCTAVTLILSGFLVFL